MEALGPMSACTCSFPHIVNRAVHMHGSIIVLYAYIVQSMSSLDITKSDSVIKCKISLVETSRTYPGSPRVYYYPVRVKKWYSL